MTRLAIACAFFFLSFHATAQTYYRCDFENGIPTDFTLVDYDQNEPSVSMKKLGFDVGKPWIDVATNKAATNHAACSTSWYAKSGKSDDWMITPPIVLNGVNPIMEWKSMATDAKHADGYAVYISCAEEPDKASFNVETPLFIVDSEGSEWTEHSVSLSKYAGKTVRIAFVNNSEDCNRLYVDDLLVSEQHKLNITSTLPTAINYQGEISFGGIVSTKENAPVSGFTVGLEVAGTTVTQHIDASVSKDLPAKVFFDHKYTLGKHETLSYKLWVEKDGDREEQTFNVTSYPQKVVCEEGTGTWCGWCVRGLVMLDSIRKHYSDCIIGISAHSGDVMDCGYFSSVSQYMGSGLPSGCINRRQKSDPKNFIAFSKALLGQDGVMSDIDLQTKYDKTSRMVSAITKLHFAEAHKNVKYALAYAIIENRVHKPGDEEYKQHNSYANGTQGVMGGYEQYGDYIPSEAMFYDDVARGYVDDLLGIDGTVPVDFESEQEIIDERSFVLPTNILVDDNVEIVVMLIDKSTGYILNAQNSELVASSSSVHTNTVCGDKGREKNVIYNVDGVRKSGISYGVNVIRTPDGHVVKVMR